MTARQHRVSFPSALGMEFKINSEDGRFEPELKEYIKVRAAELREQEEERKRMRRAWRRRNDQDQETILEEFRLGACCGGERIVGFPVFGGSHRQGGGGGAGHAGCVRLCLRACASAIGEDVSSGEGNDRVLLEEARLLNRSFDLDICVLDSHRRFRRSKGLGRVIGVGFLIFTILFTIIILSIIFSLRQ